MKLQIFILLLFKPRLCELEFTQKFFQWLLAINSLELYFCCRLFVSKIFGFSPSANLYGATYVPSSCYGLWIHSLVISALLPKAAEQTQTHWPLVCSVMEPTGQPRGQEHKWSSLCLRGQMWFHSILSGSGLGLLTVDLGYTSGFIVYSLFDPEKATKDSDSPWVPCSSHRREKSLWAGCFPDMWWYKQELLAAFLMWLVVSKWYPNLDDDMWAILVTFLF